MLHPIATTLVLIITQTLMFFGGYMMGKKKGWVEATKPHYDEWQEICRLARENTFCLGCRTKKMEIPPAQICDLCRGWKVVDLDGIGSFICPRCK